MAKDRVKKLLDKKAKEKEAKKKGGRPTKVEAKKKKETRGRKTKMTPEVIATLRMCYGADCSDAEACAEAGISVATLWTYCNANPEFLKEKERLKGKQVIKARINIHNALKDGDVDISKWYLERKRKQEFNTKLDDVESNEDKVGKFFDALESELDED